MRLLSPPCSPFFLPTPTPLSVFLSACPLSPRNAASVTPFCGWQGILEGVKVTVKAGLDAANALASLGLGGIVDITYVYFDVDLSVADGGAFACEIHASFFGGSTQKLSLHVDFRDLWGVAADLADQAFSGVKTMLTPP